MRRRGGNSIIGKANGRCIPLRVLLSVLIALHPAPLSAEEMEAMKNKAVQGVVLAVAMLNKAMRDAAENPMDEWRRENVQRAVAALPAAIVGLGMEYKTNYMKLNPFEFPAVQAMLGGFVDQSAPEQYKKFMLNPDKRNIPQLGNGFPPQAMKEAETRLEQSAPARRAPKTPQPVEDPARLGMKDGSAHGGDALASAASSSTKGKANDKNIGFDDGVAKSAPMPPASELISGGAPVPAAAPSPATASASTALPSPSVGKEISDATGASPAASGATTANVQGETLRDASRELSAIEAGLARPQGRILSTLKTERKDKEDRDDIFKLGGEAKKKEAGSREKAAGQAKPRASAAGVGGYAIQVKPKYWKVSSLVLKLEAALIKKVYAEGGEEGEKKGAGEAIAQILFGIAAIIAAIAPMVVAKIQAKADVKIAEINAETQKTLTTITANTSKYLADQQKDIALTQSAMAKQISEQNNKGVTERLDMQLAELRSARSDAQQAEKERREIDQVYNQQRIELAQKQADDNLKLAKSTLNAQLTQAGLSQGFSNSTNSGDRLGVARSGITGGASSGGSSVGSQLAAGAGAGGDTGTGFMSRITGDRGFTAPEGSVAASGGNGSVAIATVSDAKSSTTALAPIASIKPASGGLVAEQAPRAATAAVSSATPADTLLRSLTRGVTAESGATRAGDPDVFYDGDPDVDPSGKKKGARARAAGPARGPRGKAFAAYEGVVPVGRGAVARRGAAANTLIGGSTIGQRVYQAAGPPKLAAATSDLGRFLGPTSPGPSFAGYRADTAPPAPAAAQGGSVRGIRSVTAHTESAPAGDGKAYNAPSTDQQGHTGFSFPPGFSLPGFPTSE